MSTQALNVSASSNAAGQLANITAAYSRGIQERLLAAWLMRMFATPKDIPMHAGMSTSVKTATLTSAGGQLSEGQSGNGSTITQATISIALSMLGNYTAYSDIVNWTDEDDFLKEKAVPLMAEDEKDTIDLFGWGRLVGGTTVRRAGGVGARTSINQILGARDLDAALNTLEVNKAQPITEALMGSDKSSIVPIASSYIMLAHPNVVAGLRGMEGFEAKRYYNAGTDLHEAEVGCYDGRIRVFQTTNAKVFAGGGATGGVGVRNTSSSADVYVSLLLSKEAYYMAMPAWGEDGAIVTPPDQNVADALRRYGTFGWKALSGFSIADDNRILRFESAALTQ